MVLIQYTSVCQLLISSKIIPAAPTSFSLSRLPWDTPWLFRGTEDLLLELGLPLC